MFRVVFHEREGESRNFVGVKVRIWKLIFLSILKKFEELTNLNLG